MGLNSDDIAKAKNDVDLAALVGDYVALKKRSGPNLVGLCPFHSENTPSFNVNTATNYLKCFGCGWGGDAIKFVQQIEHVDFVDAARRVAARAGVTLRDDDPNADRRRSRRQQLHAALSDAADWYHAQLAAHPNPAATYLSERSFSAEVIERFDLGYAPNRGLREHLNSLGHNDAVLDAAGLIGRDGNRTWDRFRDRLMFPIRDHSDNTIGFSARQLPGGKDPKYLNSPDTEVYDKSSALFGLDAAKQAIARSDKVIVCEGQTDVMAFAQAGVPNAVAACGTAFGKNHIELLRRYASNFVLAFDADAAGYNAATRLWSLENTSQVSLLAIRFAAGSDPGDYVTRPDELAELAATATPITSFIVDAILDDVDRSSPEAISDAVSRACDVLAAHPDTIVAGQYIRSIASRFNINVEQVRRRFDRAQRSHHNLPEPEPDADAPPPADEQAGELTALAPDEAVPDPEIEALRWLVSEPTRDLGHDLTALSEWCVPELFSHPDARRMVDALRAVEFDHHRIDSALPLVDEARSVLPVTDALGSVSWLWRSVAERRLTGSEGQARIDVIDALDALESDPGIALPKLVESLAISII